MLVIETVYQLQTKLSQGFAVRCGQFNDPWTQDPRELISARKTRVIHSEADM